MDDGERDGAVGAGTRLYRQIGVLGHVVEAQVDDDQPEILVGGLLLVDHLGPRAFHRGVLAPQDDGLRVEDVARAARCLPHGEGEGNDVRHEAHVGGHKAP